MPLLAEALAYGKGKSASDSVSLLADAITDCTFRYQEQLGGSSQFAGFYGPNRQPLTRQQEQQQEQQMLSCFQAWLQRTRMQVKEAQLVRSLGADEAGWITAHRVLRWRLFLCLLKQETAFPVAVQQAVDGVLSGLTLDLLGSGVPGSPPAIASSQLEVAKCTIALLGEAVCRQSLPMEVVRKLCNTLRTVGPMAYPAAPDAPPSALQILLCKEGATALVCLKLMASGDLTVQGELVRFLASLLAKSSYTAEATPAQMQLCSRLLKGPAFVEQLCALSLTCSQPTSCVQYAPVLAGSGYELAAPAAELAGSLAVMACGCLATLAEDPAALPAMAKARVLDFAGSLLMERAKETKHLPEPLLWQALLLAKRLSPKDAGAHVFIFWNPLMLAALTRMAQATAVDAEHRDVAVWALKEAFAADSLLANVAFKEKVPAKDRETVMAWGDFMDVLHGCYSCVAAVMPALASMLRVRMGMDDRCAELFAKQPRRWLLSGDLLTIVASSQDQLAAQVDLCRFVANMIRKLRRLGIDGAETLRSHCGPPFGVVANLRLLVAVVRGMAVPTYGVHRGQVPMYDRDECADLLKDHLLDIPVLLCGEDIKEGPETLRSFADEALDRVVNTPQDERGRTLLRLVAEAILHNPALQYAEMLASPARIDRLFAALSGNDSLPLLGTRTFLESYGLMLSLLGVMLEANAARGLTLSPSEGRDHMFLAVVTVAFQDCIKEEPIVSSCFMSCLRFLGALKLLKLDWYFSFPDRWLRNLRTAGEHGDTWRKMTLIHPLRTCMRVLDKAVALGNNASAARNTASRTALAEATAFMLELLVCPWYDQHPPVADMLRELGAGPKLLALLKAPAGLVPLPEELRQRIMAMKFVQEADMAAEAAASVLMTQEDARQARAAAKAAKKQKQKQKKVDGSAATSNGSASQLDVPAQGSSSQLQPSDANGAQLAGSSEQADHSAALPRDPHETPAGVTATMTGAAATATHAESAASQYSHALASAPVAGPSTDAPSSSSHNGSPSVAVLTQHLQGWTPMEGPGVIAASAASAAQHGQAPRDPSGLDSLQQSQRRQPTLATNPDSRHAQAAQPAGTCAQAAQLHPKERLPLVDMEAMCCPITQEVMRDPVIAIDGHTYERSAIEEWFAKSNISPMTGAELDDPLATIIPNIGVRRLIECYAAVDGA